MRPEHWQLVAAQKPEPASVGYNQLHSDGRHRLAGRLDSAERRCGRRQNQSCSRGTSAEKRSAGKPGTAGKPASWRPLGDKIAGPARTPTMPRTRDSDGFAVRVVPRQPKYNFSLYLFTENMLADIISFALTCVCVYWMVCCN